MQGLQSLGRRFPKHVAGEDSQGNRGSVHQSTKMKEWHLLWVQAGVDEGLRPSPQWCHCVSVGPSIGT